KIIDFGIAKAIDPGGEDFTARTLAGQLIGTPGYVSPEQACGTADVDVRSDVYALGAILYELVTESGAFGTGTCRAAAAGEIQRGLRDHDPPVPSARLTRHSTSGAGGRLRLARDLDWIAMKALSRDRMRRYAGAGELGEDVRRFLDHEPVSATPPSLGYRLGKFVRKHRAASAFTAGTACALVAGTVLSLRSAESARAAARRESEAARREAEAHDQARKSLADTYRS